MDTNNEILDAIEILADKKISENITKILTGICKSVNTNNNTCVMDSNGVISTVQFYGSPPEVNELYRIFVPSNNMSRSFIVVPPKFTVNPNLLDNWYFGNPVNQRGQTEYTGNGYTVDRWYFDTDSGSCALTLTTEGIKFIATASATGIASLKQDIDPTMLSVFAGKTVTLSLLGKSDISQQVLFYVNSKVDAVNSSPAVNGVCMTTLTYTFPEVLTGAAIFVYGRSHSGAGEGTIIAAKLELGPTQTLAHLENGNWVLNEIPKYEDVLLNCQRYAFNVVNSDDNFEILGSGFAMNANMFFCFIPIPVTLRGKPTIKYSGVFTAVRNTGASVGIVINTMVVDHASNNGVSVICTGTTSFEVGEFYTLWCVAGSTTANSLIFSTDL